MAIKKVKTTITKSKRKTINSWEERKQLRMDIHAKVKVMKDMNVTIAKVAVDHIIEDQKAKGDVSDEVLEKIRKQTLESDIAKEMVIELNGIIDDIVKDTDAGWVPVGHLVYTKCRLESLLEKMKTKLQ